MADIPGHITGYADITTMSVVLGGRGVGGKVRILFLSRIGECAISAFEAR
jgi:hypothetical protein